MKIIKNIELWLSAIVIIIVSVIYIQVATQTSIPSASGLFGHSLGIIGSVLMIMTEVLYSIRKRYQFARFGKLQNWLSFHIFTGIVGPYLTLLHSSWKFNGLAGILTLFTLVIVISGFVGRYFYTAVPRSTEGAILEAGQISDMISSSLESIRELIKSESIMSDFQEFILGLSLGGIQSNRSKKVLRQKIESMLRTPEESEELYQLILRQKELQNQLSSLDRSRRLLAIWHTVHVPFGMAMFMIAFIHILGTLYYATLLH
jgi:hypothetical protein